MKTTSQNTSDPIVGPEASNAELGASAGAASESEARSDYGSVPGGELPVAVYLSVFAAFAWVIVASWIAFAGGGDAELALGMAAVLTIVFFALPVLVWLTAKSHSPEPRNKGHDFLASDVETATGRLSGRSMWLQIAIIPAALALAATLIGVTSMIMHS